VHHGDSTLGGDDSVRSHCHVCGVSTEHDKVVAVMRNSRCNGSGPVSPIREHADYRRGRSAPRTPWSTDDSSGLQGVNSSILRNMSS
jgi:hypothetical protein